VIALGFVHVARQERHVSQGSVIDDVVEGVRYVAKHQGILPTLILASASAMLVRPLQDLMPGFADTVFLRGAEGLAILMAAMGLGGVAGSLWIANRNRMSGTATIFLWGSLAYALCTLAFAATSSFWAAVVVMIVTGAAMSIANNTGQILIQNAVAGSMRARVMSLYSYNYRTMPAVGALAMGAAANTFGFQVPVEIAAALCVAACAWTFRRRAAMRRSLESVNEDVPQAGNAAKDAPAPKAAAE
jgi:predicted MFS family arabinose efflux permease